MFEKHFVGLDLTGVQNNGLQQPVSRVTFLLDDESSVTAGDDTGTELLADCPHATREMAEAVLARVRGYRYQMLSADGAALDPAAELGDGVTAGGLYATIARITEDGSGYASLSAPGKEELEDEYPADGPMTQAFNRKIADTRSQIIKTAKAITLLVENESNSLSTEFSVSLEGIRSTVTGLNGTVTATLDLVNGFTVKDASGITRIKGSSIDTSTISANSISADKLNLTGAITFSDLNTYTQNTINGAVSTANSAASTATSAVSAAYSAQNTVNGWVYPGTTMINGQMIQTGTVQASVLRGGMVDLISYDGLSAGTIQILKSGVGSTGIVSINSDELALNTNHPDGVLALAAYGRGNTTVLRLWNNERIEAQGSFFPIIDRYYELGLPRTAWIDLYVGNEPIITSDRSKKKDISYNLDHYDALFDALRPVSFRFIDGQSGRTHLGLISQDVEQALADSGLTDMDFAGFIKSPRKDGDENILEGEYDYALRYGEIIAMLIVQTQTLKTRVARLERRVAA